MGPEDNSPRSWAQKDAKDHTQPYGSTDRKYPQRANPEREREHRIMVAIESGSREAAE